MKKKKFTNILKVEEINYTKYIVLTGHRHLQNSGAGLKENYALQYHTRVISAGVNPKDAVAF